MRKEFRVLERGVNGEAKFIPQSRDVKENRGWKSYEKGDDSDPDGNRTLTIEFVTLDQAYEFLDKEFKSTEYESIHNYPRYNKWL